MATGIISLGSQEHGFRTLAQFFFRINEIAFVIASALLITRFSISFRDSLKAVFSHGEASFLSAIVAGTCILGSQFAGLEKNADAGFALWIAGLVLWSLFFYSFFAGLIIGETKPAVESYPDGGWLLPVVATQAVSILGTTIAPFYPDYESAVVTATVAFHFIGIMFYLAIITLVFHRLFFFRLTPEKLSPTYWIGMGAAAITSLSGSEIIGAAGRWSFSADLLPFLKVSTYFFWVLATWWIPLLVILNLWRHAWRRYPLSYHPHYWGMVFPLGMYASCTYRFGKLAAMDFMTPTSGFLIYVAVLVWAITFTGMLKRLLTTVVGARE
jgi:tellurite resistance protein TehA-like permease